MKPPTGPYTYHLQIGGPKDNRHITGKHQNGQIVRFQGPVAAKKRPKIYLIRHEGEVVYVGYADQPIGNRLRYGLNPRHQKHYHGYGWKELPEVELLVWVFDPGLERKLVEAVEAEVVYALREEYGVWPRYQTEIHFNNSEREWVLEMAGRILAAL